MYYVMIDNRGEGRLFVRERGTDNNLCEVFVRNDDETIADNAHLIITH